MQKCINELYAACRILNSQKSFAVIGKKTDKSAFRTLKISYLHGKNGFVTATKLGTNIFFVAATKNFAAAT